MESPTLRRAVDAFFHFVVSLVIVVGVAASQAAAQSTTFLENGATGQGSISTHGETDIWAFESIAKAKVSIELETSGGWVPKLELLDLEQGSSVSFTKHAKGLGTSHVSISKLPLSTTGNYRLLVSAKEEMTGPYSIRVVIKPPGKLLKPKAHPNLAPTAYYTLSFDAIAGTTMTGVASAIGKKSPALATVDALNGPKAAISLDGKLEFTPQKGQSPASTTILPLTLPGTGRYQLRVRNDGKAGKLAIEVTLTLPIQDSIVLEGSGSAGPGGVVRGTILSTDEVGFGGVTVRTLDGSISATSDLQGFFELYGIPDEKVVDGNLALVVDANTATSKVPFSVRLNIPYIAGQTLFLPTPIYIPVPDAGSRVALHGLSEQTIRNPAHPGASLVVAPGQAIFDTVPEKHKSELALVHVKRHQIPVALPGARSTDAAFAVEPFGVRFDPPSSVTLPNAEQFPPGQQVPLMQVDPETGEWTAVGSATVNEVGTLLQSDPGSGAKWGSYTAAFPDANSESSASTSAKGILPNPPPPALAKVRGSVRYRYVSPDDGKTTTKPLVGAHVYCDGYSFGPPVIDGSEYKFLPVKTDENGEYELTTYLAEIWNSETEFPLTVHVYASDIGNDTNDVHVYETTKALANSVVDMDFAIDGLQLRFFDDHNDGEATLYGTASSPAQQVHAICADGATSIRIQPVYAGSNGGNLQIKISKHGNDPDYENSLSPPGTLWLDSTSNDGDPHSGNESPYEWQSLTDVLSGKIRYRYSAPWAFFAPQFIGEDGRECRRALFNAQVRELVPGKKPKDIAVTAEPFELRIVRPPIFFIHGILNGRDKWAHETHIDDSIQATQFFDLIQGCYDLNPTSSKSVKNFEALLRATNGETSYEDFTADYKLNSTSSLDVVVPIVLEQLDDLRNDLRNFQGTACSRVHVLAHSYGGLIAREIIARHVDKGLPIPISKLATLGTPHLGATGADRVLNLTDLDIVGAPELLTEFEANVAKCDWGGLVQFAIGLEKVSDSVTPRSTYSEMATRNRMSPHLDVSRGFAEGVWYRFFYGSQSTFGDLGNWAYSNGAGRWMHGDIAPLGDRVVPIGSAIAGQPAYGQLLGSYNHTKLAAFSVLKPAVSWLQNGSSGTPVANPVGIGPVIQIVYPLELKQHPLYPAPYNILFVCRNIPTTGVLKVHYPTMTGERIRVISLPNPNVTSGAIAFNNATFPLESPGEFLYPGYFWIETDSASTNQVWVAFNDHLFGDYEATPVASEASAPSNSLSFSVVVTHEQVISYPLLAGDDGEVAPSAEHPLSPLPNGKLQTKYTFNMPSWFGPGDLVFRDGLGPTSNAFPWAGAVVVNEVGPSVAFYGDQVEVTGTGFGTVIGKTTVTVGGIEQPVFSMTPTEITFVVADGTSTAPVVVSVNGIQATKTPTLTISADSDKDGLPDEWEFAHALNPLDPMDSLLDSDGDGLSNQEEFDRHTHPMILDTDGGGMSDGGEVNYMLDPLDPADDDGDFDGDGLSIEQEVVAGTSPSNPDTDGDELSDGDEVLGSYGFVTNPIVLDTDGDMLGDGDEELTWFTNPLVADTDGDGIGDGAEVFGTMGSASSPTDPDTDDDGLTDAFEASLGTDPSDSDTDDDGLTDGEEHTLLADPLNPDTDADGFSDGTEITLGTSPISFDAATSVIGEVRKPDGSAAAGALVTLNDVPASALSATSFGDGKFLVSKWPAALSPVKARATLMEATVGAVSGTSASVPAIAGGSTDVGIVALSAPTGPAYPAPTFFVKGATPWALSAGDLDGDPFVDIVSVNRSSNDVSVLRGTAGGGFASAVLYAVGKRPIAVVLTRNDSDPYVDIVTADSESATVSVLRGTGAGVFQAAKSFAVGGGPQGLAAGDLNGDQNQDLVTTNLAGTLTILLGDGAGGFGSPTTVTVGGALTSVALARFDGDPHLDVVAVNTLIPVSLQVLLGNGQGGFSAPTSYQSGPDPRAVVVADFNSDLMSDLAVSNGNAGSVSMLLGDGLGAFGPPQTFTAVSYADALLATDLNADGLTDLVAGSYNGAYAAARELGVLLGNGAGGFATAEKVPIGSQAQSIMAAHVDGDANVDLLVARPNSNDVVLLLGQGQGAMLHFTTYSLPAGSVSVTAAASGDFDSDAWPDLAVGDGHYVDLLVNDGAGGFQLGPTLFLGINETVSSVAVGDVDGDLDLDIVSANGSSGNVAVLLGDGAGNFAAPVNYAAGPYPTQVVIGDVNGDQRADVVAVSQNNTSIALLLGFSGGGFSPALSIPVGAYPRAAGFGDLNSDGKIDIVTANPAGTVSVLLGSGAGAFSNPVLYSAGASPDRLALADLNGDQRLDVVVANSGSNSQVAVLYGVPNGGLSAPSPFSTGDGPNHPLALVLADLDADGRGDAVVANSNSSSVSVLPGSGQGFASSTSYAVSGNAGGLTVVDVDRDGKPDVIATTTSPKVVTVLRHR